MSEKGQVFDYASSANGIYYYTYLPPGPCKLRIINDTNGDGKWTTGNYLQKRQPEKVFNYYRSLIGGLKDIAQNIDKSAKKASIDYAFTMNAGLSLHKPIKPFSILHVYVRPEDREFFERMLNLVSADEKTAQLCLITTTNNNVFDSKKEMHSLSVVADMQLKQDLQELGEEQLARELEETLNA